MPIFWRSFVVVGRKYMTTMSEKYAAGTHSMAFVTVPNEDVANQIAG